MELNIKSPSSRILLERADNGVILYEIGDDNVVSSKIVYEMYEKDGIIDFGTIAAFMIETMEVLKVPIEEPETNRKLMIAIMKIDPEKADPEEENENE